MKFTFSKSSDGLISNFEDVSEALKKFRKDKYHIVPEMKGFNEQYLILVRTKFGSSRRETRSCRRCNCSSIG